MRVATTLMALCAALALGACGGDDEGSQPAKLPDALAQQLASQSEAVAASLDSGNECLADSQAAVLHASVESAIAGGGVPARLEDELRAGADRLASGIDCAPTPAAPTTTPTTTTPTEPDCATLEAMKQQLEEQRKQTHELPDELKHQLEDQQHAIDEQLKAACEGGDHGDSSGPGNSENAPGHQGGHGPD